METFSSVNFQSQIEIVQKVIDLSWEGLGYKRIIKQIKKDFSVNLSLGLLSYWFNHDVKMFGGQNHFLKKPTKELAYVLGVMFGDGNIFYHKKKQDYVVRLEAIDRDFVEHFSKCVSKVLSKETNYAVVRYKQKAMGSFMYFARARSKELYYFIKELKEDFEKVKPFANAYPKEFIQGLADSEGCPSISARNSFQVGVVVAVSTNENLLMFVCDLLFKSFEIKTKLRLQHKAGKTDSIINGRSITRTMNLYSLIIARVEDTKTYSKLIGFSIKRKQNKLIGGGNIFEKFSVSERVFEWKKRYYKPKSKWINQKTKKISSIDVLTLSPGLEPESHP